MRIIAAIIGILIIWVMFPHVRRGEIIAPNPIAPGTWMAEYEPTDYSRALATPPEGYGFRRYDAWNHPPLEGRPVTEEDLRLSW